MKQINAINLIWHVFLQLNVKRPIIEYYCNQCIVDHTIITTITIITIKIILMSFVSVIFARLQCLIFQAEYIHRYTWKLLHSKNRQRYYNVAEHPFFDVTTPDTCVKHLVSPSPVTEPFACWPSYLAGLKTLHCWKNQLELALTHQNGKESAPKMVLWSRVHMEPFSMWHDRRADSPPSFKSIT